ncbi:phage tail protein [Nostoc sp. FACHB-892]|uniref:phage tail protein n=1 Tax=Nostoc sp. FACHB-892 TaxID=2692843 RepID=UPI0016857841|nr:phage tail protein [Nostoc sp. FACHB-892]MBD2726628.1 phage tail protein [Nostoc sp. FACHB-892]
MANEYIGASVFYFWANDINEKFVKSVTGLGVKNNATTDVRGVGYKGKILRQNTPGQVEYNNVTITLHYNGDRSIYDWYSKCSQDGQKRDWEKNRKEVSIVGYSQDKQIEVIRLDLASCFPVSYIAPEFDVTNSNLVTEVIEVAIESFEITQNQKQLPT